MKFLKADKGTYGYINKKRIIEIIKTIVMFACAIGLYLIGYLTLKTNKSFWTIFSVLSVLPAAKSAVSMIMFCRFSSISQNEYNLIEDATGIATSKYEYVFTTSENSFFVKAVSILDNTIIALYKPGKKDLSKVLKEHIVTSMERDGIKGYSVKIYKDINEYETRLREMNAKLSSSNNKTDNSILALFNAISI